MTSRYLESRYFHCLSLLIYLFLLTCTIQLKANLDNQYTTGLTFPTANIYYTTPGTAPTINDSVTPPQRDEPYIDWLNFVLSHDDMPFTFTTSYGGDE